VRRSLRQLRAWLGAKNQRCLNKPHFDDIYVMSRRSPSLTELPPALRSLLRELGANLAIARRRRKESRRVWAGRIGVSELTLARLEQGDPGVAFGTYATALWLIGRAQAIAELAAPQLDLGAGERPQGHPKCFSSPSGEADAARRRPWGRSLRYAASWRAAGFPLSEDLPLVDAECLPSAKDTAAGAVDDARPDRWGERVIRFLDKPPRLSLMEYLYFAGDDRFGALGVSTSPDRYLPRHLGPLPELADVAQIDELVKKLAAGEPVPAAQRRLIESGVTMGGARPKALLNIGGEQWVLKFSEPGEYVDMPLIEHAAMTLAARAQIRVATTQAITLARGHALAVKRFDRTGAGDGSRRRHALSAHVALKAAGEGLWGTRSWPNCCAGVAWPSRRWAGPRWPRCSAGWCSTS
jgi:transcriptional regulator with XRE-family HTH domain